MTEGYTATNTYLQELTQSWWKLWKERAFPTLLPYYRYKEAGRHKNLQPGDVCLIQYDNKIRATYRLCKVIEVKKSDDGCVRTVVVGYMPR